MKRCVCVPKFSTPLRMNIRMGFVLIIFEFIIIRTVSTLKARCKSVWFPILSNVASTISTPFYPGLINENVSPLQFFFFYSEWWNSVDSSFNVVQSVYYVSISYWWRNNVHNIYCLFPKLLICNNSSLTLVSWRQHIFFQSFLWCLKFGVGAVEKSTRKIVSSFSFSSDAVISSTIPWSLKCSCPGPSALNQSFISVIIQM